MKPQTIARLINSSPMNRGMNGEAWLNTPGNIAVVENRTILLFERMDCGVYEFHWLLGVGRPREIITATLKAIDQVFVDTGCALMYGLVPKDRKDSNFMARKIGAKPLGQVPTEHGICEMFIMTKEIRQGAIS